MPVNSPAILEGDTTTLDISSSGM